MEKIAVAVAGVVKVKDEDKLSNKNNKHIVKFDTCHGICISYGENS